MAVTSSLHLEHACLALDHLAWLEGVLVGKAKEPPTILTDAGFIRAILREARLLQKEVGRALSSPLVRSGLKRATGINWRGATDALKDRALTAMERLIAGLPSEFMPGAKVILDQEGRAVTKDTHEASSKKHSTFDLDPTFALKNERAIGAISDTTSIFFKPEYEAQADRFRRRAQDTMARGLSDGLDSRGIGANLKREFRDAGLHRSYWDTVAANHVNRARSFSALATYAENGLTSYEVVAVMDERTTEVCRMMDGTILSIEEGLNAFDAFEAAEDLEQVKQVVAPFMRRDGGRIVTAGGVEVATRVGNGWNRVSPDRMSASGVNSPPYHHRCRTTLVPVI